VGVRQVYPKEAKQAGIQGVVKVVGEFFATPENCGMIHYVRTSPVLVIVSRRARFVR
jgi:hypothetical protein